MDDFDFLHGVWDVANRRLAEPLSDRSDDWQEFPGRAFVRPLFGGAGNIDEITFPTLGYQGVTLRLYDPERKQWAIHWSDSRSGRLDPPVTGSFTGDRGDFHGDDAYGVAPSGSTSPGSGSATTRPAGSRSSRRTAVAAGSATG